MTSHLQQMGAGLPDPDITTPVRRYFEEVHNQRQFAVMDKIFGPNWQLDGYKEFLAMAHHAFPYLTFTIGDQIVAGDKVVTRWTMHGRHEGTWEGDLGPVKATGRSVSVDGITIDRVEGQLIVDRWHVADMLGLLRQLGAISC